VEANRPVTVHEVDEPAYPVDELVKDELVATCNSYILAPLTAVQLAWNELLVTPEGEYANGVAGCAYTFDPQHNANRTETTI
jgi:hypothetical protein